MIEYPFYSNFKKAAFSLSEFPWRVAGGQPLEFHGEFLEALRIEAFRLQSFGRILQKSSRKNQELLGLANRLRENAKSVEDAFGSFLFFHEMKAMAQKNSLNLESLALVEAEWADAGLIFGSQMVDLEKDSNDCSQALQALEALGLDIRKLYIKGLRRTLKKIAMETLEVINPSELEDGTHELRRQLRWAIMGFVYPQGLFGYSKLSSKINKYTELAPSVLNMPILVPPKPLILLSQQVSDLGKVKDLGLYEHFIHKLENRMITQDINKSRPEIIDATKKSIKTLQKEKVFEDLRDALK